MHMNSISAKKRIMFIDSEDYYFITYNALIALKSLGCYTGKLFKDCRKLPHIISILNSPALLEIVKRRSLNIALSIEDKSMLSLNYSKSIVQSKEYFKVLFALDRHEILNITKSSKDGLFDCHLIKTKALDEFISGQIFFNDQQRALLFFRYVQRCSSLTYETFISKIYARDGVTQWLI